MNVPQLRFDGFGGEWEKKRFYECVEIQGKLVDPRKEEYKNLPHIGPGNIAKFTGQLLNYKLVKNEELISGKFEFNHQDVIYSKIRPELNKVVFPEFSGLCSADAYPLRAIEGMMEPYFLFQQLMSPKFIKFSISVSMRTGMPKINRDELASFTFHVPKIAEQKKISEFFRLLNLKIQKQQEKIEKLEQFKKGMMQKIFSQELRFKDDGGGEFGEWEKGSIGQVFKERSERGNPELELLAVTINSGVMKRSEIEKKDSSSKNKDNYKTVYSDDIVYNSMRMWQGASGISNFTGIVSPAYTVLSPNKDVSSHYFGYLFKTENLIQVFQNNSQGLTSDTWNLKYPALSKIKISIPSFQEQKKISSYLAKLDTKIEKEKEKLMVLEEQKKGFMQEMLV